MANSGGGDATALPRVAHMVLTANQHSPCPAPPDALQSPKGLYSSHVAQQGKPQVCKGRGYMNVWIICMLVQVI